MVIKAGRALLAAVILVLAGCAGPSSNKFESPGNWSGTSPNWSGTEQSATKTASANTGRPQLIPPPGVPLGSAEDPFDNEIWVPLGRWAQTKGLPAPERFVIDGGPAWRVEGPGGRMALRGKGLLAQWDGAEVHLGFTPQLQGGQLYLHRLDLRKTLTPLLLESRLGALTGAPVVLLDPGHGGEDPGTLSVQGGLHEKSLALDWATRLQKLLLAAGWKAYLTRTNDTYISIPDRIAMADRLNAAAFISLHFNSAAPNKALSGVETYCLTPTGSASHLTRGFFDGPEQAFPNNAFDLENFQLACRVHRALVGMDGAKDRGVRRARFLGVLRTQNRPAILVEAGYLSNPEEARRIAEPGYRQLLAEAVARALLGNGKPGALASVSRQH